MDINITTTWKGILEEEFSKDYFIKLNDFIDAEYGIYTCYPLAQDIYSAFNSCSFDDVKVVIIGQDPYHGIGQAHGLCFSVNEGVSIPPSLVNIYKELQADIGKHIPETGCLEHWSNQGVLLLNSILTVRENEAGSHKNKGWEKFTDAVIKLISEKNNNVVFMLWGGYAKKKGKAIDNTRHLILESGHPSPLSANRGYWFGNKHFSKANEYLLKNKKPTINW